VSPSDSGATGPSTVCAKCARGAAAVVIGKPPCAIVRREEAS
jgi:hypothetical protein